MSKAISPRKGTNLERTPFRGLFSRHMFEDMLHHFLSDGNGLQVSELMNAAMDVAETDQAFEVKLDLPGVKAEDVDIQIDNNTLTVRGQRTQETEEKDEERQYHRMERYTGSFSRSVVLPNSTNDDETIAEFKDGVLKIVIPKTEDAKPRKINIKS